MVFFKFSLVRYIFILCQTATLESFVPLFDKNISLQDDFSLSLKYIESASNAASPNGINLSLEPLPNTFTTFLFISMSVTLRLISSDILIPVA